jgi:hypothetical protein
MMSDEYMTVTHTSRTGKIYFLHAGVTKTGKAKYFFSLKQDAEQVDAIPEGFEIYENVNGQVFLRRIQKQIITPEELALVEGALREQGEAWEYRTEIKKNAIWVYESGTDVGGISDLIATYTGRPMSTAEQLRHAHYMAVMRFVLTDKTARTFVTERYCFKGSVDDWIFVDGPAQLADQVGKYIQHLGRESFYELF